MLHAHFAFAIFLLARCVSKEYFSFAGADVADENDDNDDNDGDDMMPI